MVAEWIRGSIGGLFGVGLLLGPGFAGAETPEEGEKRYSLTESAVGHELKAPDGRTVFQYMTIKPERSELTANSTCCFYPVFTPKGTRVVDFAPDDHRHHRGIFLAWFNIQGKISGDFWGWGEHAPTEGRVIRHKRIHSVQADAERASLVVENDWMAEESVLLSETTRIGVHERGGAYVIDLDYHLTPRLPLTLSRSAFSGFTVKSRKARSVCTTPAGVVDLSPPHHLKPEKNWPAQRWYDYTFTLADGTQAGVAVIDHRDNPATTWHNPQSIAMLNPCIVAPGDVKMSPEQPLRLRYRLVVHDGPASRAVIEEAARDFARE